jgi:hypothetical protein
MLLTILKLLAVGAPIACAVSMRWLGKTRPDATGWVAAITAALAALLGLTLFLAERHYACVLITGDGNCLWEGLGTFSLFVVGLGLALKMRSDIVAQCPYEAITYRLLLLMIAGWAGLALSPNLLFWILSWALFSSAFYRWLDKMGIFWGFMVIHDSWYDNHRHNR